MTAQEAKIVINALLDVDGLELSERSKAQLKEALETVISLAKDTKQGLWIYKEITEQLNGGGSLLKRGYVCSNCNYFIRKKNGLQDYCAGCGSKNTEKKEEV